MGNKLKVKIKGPQGSGKTTLFHLLAKSLEEKGFVVDLSKASETLIAGKAHHSICIQTKQTKEVKNG